MQPSLIAILTLVPIVWVVRRLFKQNWYALDKQVAFLSRPKTSRAQAKAWVTRFGHNSNAFMTLYPGFEYFTSERPEIPGCIAFVDAAKAWVGAAEPLTPPECTAELLEDFSRTAAELGKSVMLLPVNQTVAEKAIQLGYQAFLIGSEPTFRFEVYPQTGKTWASMIPSARRLDSKGARVVELDPRTASSEIKRQLDSIKDDWIRSRKMATLGFLNQVDPWLLQEDKKYFYVEDGGQILAFLAAIPIPPRNAWYLIDLFRKKDSPAGSTELLLLQAMKQLRDAGASEVTLGVAPLSGLENAYLIPAAGVRRQRILYGILRFFYENGNLLYNFKSLHRFKLKFEPTTNEPAFLIYRDARRTRQRFGLGSCWSLLQAFVPDGLAAAAYSGLRRSMIRLSLSDVIRSQLATGTVVRSAPRSMGRLLLRCRLTVALLAANLLFFVFTTDSRGMIFPSVERSWAYSWEVFIHRPWQAVMLSPFLHWHVRHLNVNQISLIAFTGGLEYLVGTRIAAICYFVPALLTNPITSLLFWLLPWWARGSALAEIDVGASLGIFGCAATLSRFFRHRWFLPASLALLALAQAWATGEWMVLNHLIAILMGLGLGRALLGK